MPGAAPLAYTIGLSDVEEFQSALMLILETLVGVDESEAEQDTATTKAATSALTVEGMKAPTTVRNWGEAAGIAGGENDETVEITSEIPE